MQLPSASTSSMLALWVAFIGVLGTLFASVITQVFQIIQQHRKERREDEVKAKEEQAAAKKEEELAKKALVEERRKSDAACWAQIKLKLDDVYWNVHRIRPGARSVPDGEGLMYDPFVGTANSELLEAANDVLRVLYSVSFFDERSQQSLLKIMKEFQDIVRKAGESKYFREQVQTLHQSHYADDSKQANREAIQRLEQFDGLYRDITIIVRDYVGYHYIFG